MIGSGIKRVLNLLMYRQARYRHFYLGLILMLLPTVYIVVYFTGGIQYVYAHSMYVPIILAAIVFGLKGGAIIGFIGGVLLGPVMPLTIDPLVMQSPINWLTRLTVFILIGGLVGFICDLLRKQYKTIRHNFSHHAETGLPNYQSERRIFEKLITSDTRVAMTLIIDNYEDIVILMGREAYHELMVEIYHELLSMLSSEVHMVQIDDRKLWLYMSLSVYDKVFDKMLVFFEEKVFLTKNVPVFVDVFMGVCLPSKEIKTPLEMLGASEVAALHARKKQLRYAVYEDAYNYTSGNIERLGALPTAIKNDKLFMEYQPIIDLKMNKPIALEALVRWNHEGKVVEPLDFIPIAEETKLIDAVTEWIVKKVVEDYPSLTQDTPYVVAINLSQRNLYNPTLIDRIVKLMSERQYDHKAFAVEMTESTMMLNVELTNALLHRLRTHNVTTAIDDFGTGYSSLSSLMHLPIDKIKIARELIMDMKINKASSKLVQMIINYAHEINLEVIAEGIEDEATERLLKDYGCDYGQGFYYTKSLPLTKVIAWLNKHGI